MLRNKQKDINMSSNNNIPKLRFPGFTGKWVEKRFDSITFPEINLKMEADI